MDGYYSLISLYRINLSNMMGLLGNGANSFLVTKKELKSYIRHLKTDFDVKVSKQLYPSAQYDRII